MQGDRDRAWEKAEVYRSFFRPVLHCYLSKPLNQGSQTQMHWDHCCLCPVIEEPTGRGQIILYRHLVPGRMLDVRGLKVSLRPQHQIINIKADALQSTPKILK